MWALDWGKPLDNGGGHDVDATAFSVLLLEGDVEVVSPLFRPTYLG
jgi:hypothetical protein